MCSASPSLSLCGSVSGDVQLSPSLLCTKTGRISKHNFIQHLLRALPHSAFSPLLRSVPFSASCSQPWMFTIGKLRIIYPVSPPHPLLPTLLCIQTRSLEKITFSSLFNPRHPSFPLVQVPACLLCSDSSNRTHESIIHIFHWPSGHHSLAHSASTPAGVLPLWIRWLRVMR